MGSMMRGDGRGGLWRSRWAAIGAAVAVTLGGGGLFVANAASSVPSSVVTIDPVRILDTRTDVGLAGPFVSGVSQKLRVTGAAVPAGATGVLLNATVASPVTAGFLSVRPGDATGAPSTSSLNFDAGVSALANAVQVGLPTTGANAGQIDITFDAYGRSGPTTEVLIDVVGYMIAGGTGTAPAGPVAPDPAVLARLTALETDNAALKTRVTALEASRPFARAATASDVVGLPSAPTPVLDVQVIAPVAGNVTINYSTYVRKLFPGFVLCAPFRSTEIPTPPGINGTMQGMSIFESAAAATVDEGFLSGTAQFSIGAGQTITYSLACQAPRWLGVDPSALVAGRAITAIFTPAP